MPYIICSDIGGTKINTGIIENKRVIKNHRIITHPKKGLSFVMRQLKKSLAAYHPEKARAISLSWAGPVDTKRGVILNATNFPKGFINYPLKKIVRSWFQRPTFLEHDGFCFALSESIFGAGKNYRYVLGLTLGTGIGGGFTIDKKIYRGYKNLAEIGHMQIIEKGFKCSCGQFGHFESQASGPALSRYYKNLTGRYLTGDKIDALARGGDEKALKAGKTLARYLAMGLANYINTLSPEIIIIGGGVSKFKNLIGQTKSELTARVIYPGLNRINIVKSRLEDDALLLGASLITDTKYYLN